jgi:hypothetical protein
LHKKKYSYLSLFIVFTDKKCYFASENYGYQSLFIVFTERKKKPELASENQQDKFLPSWTIRLAAL